MKRIFLLKHVSFLLLILLSTVSFAHQPDVSNIVISKTASGQIILQINSSLTAFQQEVNYINGKGVYKSPEHFRNLVVKHFYKTFSMVINKKDTLQFINPKVFLGHETKLVAEITGLPKEVDAIYVKNELFKDIHQSQSSTIFLLDSFPQTKYNLNRDNKYQLNVTLNNGKWISVDKENTNAIFKYVASFVILLVLVALFYFIRKKKRQIRN